MDTAGALVVNMCQSIEMGIVDITGISGELQVAGCQ
jgi:hypothetical protein